MSRGSTRGSGRNNRDGGFREQWSRYRKIPIWLSFFSSAARQRTLKGKRSIYIHLPVHNLEGRAMEVMHPRCAGLEVHRDSVVARVRCVSV